MVVLISLAWVVATTPFKVAQAIRLGALRTPTPAVLIRGERPVHDVSPPNRAVDPSASDGTDLTKLPGRAPGELFPQTLIEGVVDVEQPFGSARTRPDVGHRESLVAPDYHELRRSTFGSQRQDLPKVRGGGLGVLPSWSELHGDESASKSCVRDKSPRPTFRHLSGSHSPIVLLCQSKGNRPR